MKDTDPWGRPYGGIPYNGHPCFRVKGPRDYLYMQVTRFFLRCVSGWPMAELGEKPTFCEGKYHAVYNTCLSLTFFTSQSWYLIENYARLTFFDLGHMGIAMLLNVVSSSRGFTLCLSKKYKSLAVKFLTESHMFFFKDKSDYSRKVYAQVHRTSNWFTALQAFIFGIACFLFNVVPAYTNYKNGKFETLDDPVNSTYELSIYFKLPLDPERSFKVYCYSLVLNWYASYLCGTSIIMFDLFLALIIINLWGHFKLLLHALHTFPRPVDLRDGAIGGSAFNRTPLIMYSTQEQAIVSDKLKDLIRYHRMIIDFTNDMSDCFGIVLFIYFSFHKVSGCIMLLECFQGSEALARYLPLTIMMTLQLIQISIIFETIGSMSEKLKDEIFCLPWEYMNTSNRKTVFLFLNSVQEPVHVRAGGLVDVGVTTMAAILKASFSYFTFLRTMSD